MQARARLLERKMEEDQVRRTLRYLAKYITKVETTVPSHALNTPKSLPCNRVRMISGRPTRGDGLKSYGRCQRSTTSLGHSLDSVPASETFGVEGERVSGWRVVPITHLRQKQFIMLLAFAWF